jgi:hypothetical protein
MTASRASPCLVLVRSSSHLCAPREPSVTLDRRPLRLLLLGDAAVRARGAERHRRVLARHRHVAHPHGRGHGEGQRGGGGGGGGSEEEERGGGVARVEAPRVRAAVLCVPLRGCASSVQAEETAAQGSTKPTILRWASSQARTLVVAIGACGRRWDHSRGVGGVVERVLG